MSPASKESDLGLAWCLQLLSSSPMHWQAAGLFLALFTERTSLKFSPD